MQVEPSLIQLSVVDWKVFKLFYIREPEGPDEIPQFDDALRLFDGNKTSHESTVRKGFEVWKNWVEHVDLFFDSASMVPWHFFIPNNPCMVYLPTFTYIYH